MLVGGGEGEKLTSWCRQAVELSGRACNTTEVPIVAARSRGLVHWYDARGTGYTIGTVLCSGVHRHQGVFLP